MVEKSKRVKPLISILMATYNPRMDWFKEQLLSLNNQSYDNLELIVRDDCSSEVDFSDIELMVKETITNFKYTIYRNDQNLGSNSTFERLTADGNGEFFAYCDQDDIWLPEKISTLYDSITKNNDVSLTCSDMFIIDGDGNTTANSITAVRKHHVFHSGKEITSLLFRNFVTGCAMLIKADVARSAIPFCKYYVHDQYLALWATAHGSVCSIPDKLIKYRIHGNNQTGLMTGVKDKESYKRVRIDSVYKQLDWMKSNFTCSEAFSKSIEDGLSWIKIRQDNWQRKKGSSISLWKSRKFGASVSLFEIFAARMNPKFFMMFIKLIQKNII